VIHVVHNYGKTARGDLGQLVHPEKSFEQKDAARIVLLAQDNGRAQLEQREAVGIGERGQHPQQPVSVRIGFDDGENLRAGGALASNRKVRPQRCQVYLGQDWASHDGAARIDTNLRRTLGQPVWSE
jgi:hypothetical protein